MHLLFFFGKHAVMDLQLFQHFRLEPSQEDFGRCVITCVNYACDHKGSKVYEVAH